MANPSWFNETYYLTSKLAQLQATGKTEFINVGQVKAAIEGAGMTTYDHFVKYSASELTSPNTYFDAEQYLAAKAKQIGGSATAESVQTAIMNAGMTLYGHFMKYGWAENVNPSNSFDVSDYIAAKAEDAGKTVEEVTAAFKAAGLDPIAHYFAFGQAEGITVPAVPSGETVLEDDTSGNDYGVSLQLTRNIDSTDPAVRPGANILKVTDKDDKYTGTVAPGATTENTLNSDDWIDGQSGTDRLTVQMNGANYTGNARVKAVEELFIGTNDVLVGGRYFDYNTNLGSQQITDVTLITYDQITANEIQGVTHILKTGDAIPTLAWTNEANATAGQIQADFRQSAIDGTSTVLNVQLNNVLASVNNAATGQLDIGLGIETLNIVSGGTSGRNTLNGAQHDDNGASVNVDIVSEGSGTLNQNWVLNDGVADNGSLTKVVITGTQILGKAAEVITATGDAHYGLTDRRTEFNSFNNAVVVVNELAAVGFGTDLGISGNGALTLRATSSNLLSVAATVTEVDASAAEAAVNVRFTQKQNNSATNVTFKGGKGGDYVEFELGTVNATGGDGDDTFAFINAEINSTFDSTDVIDGGAGDDTFQVGVNGYGARYVAASNTSHYTLSATEFNNKGSIETLDLRGASQTVTLSQEFVDKAQKTLTVRTDKVFQTSATNPDNDTTNGNPATNLLLEDAMVSILDTTNLNQNTALIFKGGSGSDRLIADNESFNQFVQFDGGTNLGQNAVAAGADYDTITIKDSAVVDGGDLQNVINFEGFNLVKTQATAQINITLTQKFIDANTKDIADNNAGYGQTSINDTRFHIGTAAAANANALTNVDTVTIDVTDLYNTGFVGGGIKTSLVPNSVDLSSLYAAGVTVQFRDASGLIAAATVAPWFTGIAAAAATAEATAVIGASAAVPGNNLGITFTSGVGPQNVIGTNNDDTFTVTQNDTITGGTGSDTVNLNAATAAGAAITLGAGADTVFINNAAALGGGTAITTTGGGTVNVTIDEAGTLAAAVAGFTSFNYTTIAQTGAVVDNGAAIATTASAGGVFALGTGGQTFTGSGTVAYDVTDSTGADTITITSTATTTTITASVAAANGADTYNLNAGAVTVIYAHATNNFGANADTITGFTPGIAGDVLRFDDNVNLVLAGVDALVFASGTAAVLGAQMLDAAQISVGVITGQAYANYAAVEAALNAAGRTEADGQIIVYFDQTANAVLAVHDTTAAAGGSSVVATLGGMTLADLATLAAVNFSVI